MYFFNYHEAKSLSLIPVDSSKANMKRSWKPLFHGTRLYSISMEVQEKWTLHETCFLILESLSNMLRHNEKTPDFSRAPLAQVAYGNYGTKDFQYEDFYLTDNVANAIGYSKMPFGEIGEMLRQMIKVAEKAEIKIPQDLKEKISYFNSQYSRFVESTPIVLVFQNIKFSDMKMEDGSKITSKLKKSINELCIGFNRNDSFRLLVKDYHYDALYFDEDLYDQALEYFAFRK